MQARYQLSLWPFPPLGATRPFSIVAPSPMLNPPSSSPSPLPENKPLFPGSLPENKLLFPGRLPENNLFLKFLKFHSGGNYTCTLGGMF